MQYSGELSEVRAPRHTRSLPRLVRRSAGRKIGAAKYFKQVKPSFGRVASQLVVFNESMLGQCWVLHSGVDISGACTGLLKLHHLIPRVPGPSWCVFHTLFSCSICVLRPNGASFDFAPDKHSILANRSILHIAGSLQISEKLTRMGRSRSSAKCLANGSALPWPPCLDRASVSRSSYSIIRSDAISQPCSRRSCAWVRAELQLLCSYTTT